MNDNVQTSMTKESSHSTSFSDHPRSNFFLTNNDCSSRDYQQRDHGYKMNFHDPINNQQMMLSMTSSRNTTIVDPRSAVLHSRFSTGNLQLLPDDGVHELRGGQNNDYNTQRPCTEGSSSSSGYPGTSDQDRVSTNTHGDAPRETVGQNHHQSQNTVVWNDSYPSNCGGSAYAGTMTPRFFLPLSSFSYQQPAFLTRLYPEFHGAENATGRAQTFLESASSHSYTKHLQGSNVPEEEQDKDDDKLDADFRSIGRRQGDDLLLPHGIQTKKRRVETTSGITTSHTGDLQNQGTTLNNSSIASAVVPPPRLRIPPDGLLFTDGVQGRGTSFGGFTPAAEIINQENLNQMLSLPHRTSSMIHPSTFSATAAAAITNLQEVSGSQVSILGPFFVALPASSHSVSSTVSSSTGTTTSRSDHATAGDVQTCPRNPEYLNTSNGDVSTIIPPSHLQYKQESACDPEDQVFVSSSSVSTCTSGGNIHLIRTTGGSSPLGRRTPPVVSSIHHHRGSIRTREDGSDDGILTLKTPSDVIWLSPFLCFLREECCEVFKASGLNVKGRRKAKKVKLNQVGIRCRFCFQLPHSERKLRSACFPSSIDRIYQSVTMMVREHFSMCEEFPPEIRQKYTALKKQSKKGEMESKIHWQNAAREIGMVDVDCEEDEEEGGGCRKKGIFLKDDL